MSRTPLHVLAWKFIRAVAIPAWVTSSSAVAWAQAPIHLSIDGGLACSRNKIALDSNRPDIGGIGNKGCGGTGGVEVGQTGAALPFANGFFDHWAVRGRFTTYDQERTGPTTGGGGPGGTFAIAFEDKRTVLDAEIGKKFNGLSLFGGTSYATLGVRYADWNGTGGITLSGRGPNSASSADLSTQGFGPRIGLRSSIPLGTHWMYESRLGAAALFANHDLRSIDQFGAVTSGSSSGTVWSVESASALSYRLNGNDTGPVFSVGVLSEYWFGQFQAADGTRLNRHSIGPFARMRVPLAP